MKVPRLNPLYMLRPTPAPPAFGNGAEIPEEKAGILSRLALLWLSPLVSVGFGRPLELDDLWSLPSSQLTGVLAEGLEAEFYGSRASASPSATEHRDVSQGSEAVESEPQPTSKPESQSAVEPEPSLFRALHRQFFWRWWLVGGLTLGAQALTTTAPLVSRKLLTWLTETYVFAHLSPEQRAEAGELGLRAPRGIGYGIALGIGLFLMQETANLMTAHYLQFGMSLGMSAHTALIGAIFRKSLRLSPRARLTHSSGKVMTMISTDTQRVDGFAMVGHHLWVAPIQLIIAVGLLIGTLGYSALVGLGVLILSLPVQTFLVVIMFQQRKKGVALTDKRVRLSTEVLQSIRLLKLFAWEHFYAHKITSFRRGELDAIRKSVISTATLIALVTFVPVLASVLSFVTYALTGHDLNVAIIFTSLQFFNIIQLPLIIIPATLGSLSELFVAMTRISGFLRAEERPPPYLVDANLKLAMGCDLGTEGKNDHDGEEESSTGKYAVVCKGDFVWDLEVPEATSQDKEGKPIADRKEEQTEEQKAENQGKRREDERADKGTKKTWWMGRRRAEEETLPTVSPDSTVDAKSENNVKGSKKAEAESGAKDEHKDQPFMLKNLTLNIPKGAFVAIVGRVGSGKTSILQALLGEMRKTSGEVKFGGSLAYIPQVPWIRNATLRENIIGFASDRDDREGPQVDEERFRQVIHASSLLRDIESLPNGENTEIGEKGVNLSGGQKARISLARAAYSTAPIVLLDDPISAVDSHVANEILENCLLSPHGPMAGRTLILVTHTLGVLDRPEVDRIFVVEGGAISEEGTYADLIANEDSSFARIMAEHHGGQRTSASSQVIQNISNQTGKVDIKELTDKLINDPLMQLEERNTGAVTWDTYLRYFRLAGGVMWVPVILGTLAMFQGAQVGTTLLLGFWTSESIPGFREGDYIALYASFGAAQALFSFILTCVFAIIGIQGSLNLFTKALNSVLGSPVSFFDTTPIGRILSRLSKDQDTLDTLLPITMMQFLSLFSSVIGTVGLIFYTFPLLGVIFAPMVLIYGFISTYYRRSSVEVKRLDSLARSGFYSSFSESLTGIATIRAYQDEPQAIKIADHGLDLENRAFYTTISLQQWIIIRLDFFANILVLGIALFAAGFSDKVNPSKIGVVLTYALSTAQMFTQMITQFAQNEQNMNAVERLLVYTELPAEEPDTGWPLDRHEKGSQDASWPSEGQIEFKDVDMAYRDGLPLVLKNVSFCVKAGEKVGVVGRTGAGKSSLLQALFRTVEIERGNIEIDGRDISEVRLETLRSKLALVPQDSTLFLGTLRENLDPLGMRTDAELISVLQRAWLLPRTDTNEPGSSAAETKYSLDSNVDDEGSNFSAGEKQLLALCRALVKASRIIVLDEATSSVDVETDAKIQRTIQSEFEASTLICIAHRLHTIAHYDRVLVMDSGCVAEYGTVLELYDQGESIFRSLCDEAGMDRGDIIRIREAHGV